MDVDTVRDKRVRPLHIGPFVSLDGAPGMLARLGYPPDTDMSTLSGMQAMLVRVAARKDLAVMSDADKKRMIRSGCSYVYFEQMLADPTTSDEVLEVIEEKTGVDADGDGLIHGEDDEAAMYRRYMDNVEAEMEGENDDYDEDYQPRSEFGEQVEQRRRERMERVDPVVVAVASEEVGRRMKVHDNIDVPFSQMMGEALDGASQAVEDAAAYDAAQKDDIEKEI